MFDLEPDETQQKVGLSPVVIIVRPPRAAMVKRSSSCPSFSNASDSEDDVTSTTATNTTNQGSQDSQESVNHVSDQGQGTLGLRLTAIASHRSEPLDAAESPGEKTPEELYFRPWAPSVPADQVSQSEVQPGSASSGAGGFQFATLMALPLQPQAIPAVPCQQLLVMQGQNQMICQMGQVYPAHCLYAPLQTTPSLPFSTGAASYTDYQSAGMGAGAKSKTVPKPEIREKLSSGCCDNLCFMTDKSAEELCDLPSVGDSGFHEEVKAFLIDPTFPWTILALVRMPAYQNSVNYGISGPDANNSSNSNILGVVAIKSSDGPFAPLKISVGIWLQRKDRSVLRDIIGQVVLQVFGENPMRQDREVRRNSLTLNWVDENTPVEVQITCVSKDDELQLEVGVIELKCPDGEDLHETIFKSPNIKLMGEELDFRNLAIKIARRLKKRPKQSVKTKKNFAGDWLPGNLFKCKMSQQLEELARDPDFRAELDGHIVVLLPSDDCHGSLDVKEDVALVAVVDTRKRAIFKVPRKILHPVSKPNDLREKYKYPVLVKSGDTWQEPRKARLCMKEVGAGGCRVEFPDGKEWVEPADLRYARELPRDPILADGQDAATVARSAEQASTILT